MEKVKFIFIFLIFTFFSYANENENLLIIKTIEDNSSDPIDEIIFFIHQEFRPINDEIKYFESLIKYKKLPFSFNKKLFKLKIYSELLPEDNKNNYNKIYDNTKVSGIINNSIFLNNLNILDHNFLLVNKFFSNQFNITVLKDFYNIFNKNQITYFKNFYFSNVVNFNYEKEFKYTGISLYFEENFNKNKFYQDFFINYTIDKNWFNTGIRLNFNIINIFYIMPLFIYANNFYYALSAGFNYNNFILNMDNFIITDFNSTKYSFNLFFSYNNDFFNIKVFKLNKNLIDFRKNYHNTISENKFLLYIKEIDPEKLYTIDSISGIEILFFYKIFSITINSIFFFEKPFLDVNFTEENKIDFFNNYSSLLISFDFKIFIFESKIYLYFFKEIIFKYGINFYFNEIKITKYFEMSSGLIFFIDKNNSEYTILPDITFSFKPAKNSTLYVRSKSGIDIKNSVNFIYFFEAGFKINF